MLKRCMLTAQHLTVTGTRPPDPDAFLGDRAIAAAASNKASAERAHRDVASASACRVLLANPQLHLLVQAGSRVTNYTPTSSSSSSS
jgi:hypothetical protein